MTKDIKPAATYENPEIQKNQIYSENKGKSGIYRWINKLNGKSYIGSSVDLTNRFWIYYSEKSMETYLKRGRSAIYTSIIKYGISKFKLEILVYCSKKKCIKNKNILTY
jgi:group I intron endonuclease